MGKLINLIKRLMERKFTGRIEVEFNEGGIRTVKEITVKTIES